MTLGTQTWDDSTFETIIIHITRIRSDPNTAQDPICSNYNSSENMMWNPTFSTYLDFFLSSVNEFILIEI